MRYGPGYIDSHLKSAASAAAEVEMFHYANRNTPSSNPATGQELDTLRIVNGTTGAVNVRVYMANTPGGSDKFHDDYNQDYLLFQSPGRSDVTFHGRIFGYNVTSAPSSGGFALIGSNENGAKAGITVEP